MSRLVCAIVKLLTYRMGKRIDRFGQILGGDE